jgi:glycosyltransferase involved in cell wall biosynthesis
MVAEGRTGLLFASGSASDLAQQLARLATQPELLARMGAAARRRAAELFDLTANAQKLLGVLGREVPALNLHPEVAVAPE